MRAEKTSFEAPKVGRLVRTSCILEIITGLLFLLGALAVLVLGIFLLFTDPEWSGEAFGSVDILFSVFSFLGISEFVAMTIFFVLSLTLGLIITISGRKGLKAVQNPTTLILFKKRTFNHSIFYIILVIFSVSGIIFFLESWIFTLCLAVFWMLMLGVIILKLIAHKQIPSSVTSLHSIGENWAEPAQQPKVNIKKQAVFKANISKKTENEQDNTAGNTAENKKKDKINNNESKDRTKKN